MSKAISLFLAGVLVVLLGNWVTVQAQIAPITPIPIALTSGASSPTYRPADLDQADKPNERATVGDDNRIPVVSEKFPWAAIGRIYWVKTNGEEFGACTGTLISKDVVLTNSHCIGFLNENQQPTLVNMIFKPNLIEGSFVEPDKATATVLAYGWEDDWDNPAEDWALLKINKPLGEEYGYLGWRELDFSNPNVLNALRGQIRVAGYSGDYPSEAQKRAENLSGNAGETASVQIGCSIDGLSENLSYRSANSALPAGWMLHDCDTMGGSSGSAILAKFDDDNYSVIGLHRGSVDLDPESLPASLRETCTTKNGIAAACRNIGVQVSRWAEQAAAMRQ